LRAPTCGFVNLRNHHLVSGAPDADAKHGKLWADKSLVLLPLLAQPFTADFVSPWSGLVALR
jgi:hypothetical protein